jgi:signal transduction histidine kinase/HPt (histidine-containing phosphotransfer) domain-containing protein/ActR/RegA family two-component response regulator
MREQNTENRDFMNRQLFFRVFGGFNVLGVCITLAMVITCARDGLPARELCRVGAVGLGASVALALAHALVITRSVTRDTSRLADAVRTIVAGDYAARVRHETHDEWSGLVDAINALAAQLEEREHDRERADAMTVARDAALQASRLKSEFLANMSHEIRTPLTAVLGYADLLLAPNLPPSERVEHVLTIRRNGEHLLSVLNDILDISKIEAGHMELERVPCSPSRVLLDVVSLMRARAAEKGLFFEARFITPVPRRIQSDPTRLHQIIVNLVGNAIKFTSAGMVRVLVSCIDPDSDAPRLTFEVVDTGVGMSPEQSERIFQPFVQADTSTTRRFGGTGLGLVISRRLAQMLGGDLNVESALQRGSTFTLTITTGPLAGVAMRERLEESVRPRTANSSAPERRARLSGRVLLAEDGRDNQVLISTLLRRAGLDVTVVENGRRAVSATLDAARDGSPFDVIFMDMQMPELDGYGATSQLRHRGYPGAVVALTAHAMAGDRERCLAAGCTDYLTKPLRADQLLATAARYLPEGDPPAAREGTAARPPTPSHAPLVSEFDDDPDLRDIVVTFCHELPGLVTDLRSARARGDLGLLKSLAHQLKGAGGGYGFQPITDAAGRIESLCAANDGAPTPRLDEALDALDALCQRVRAPRIAVARAHG